MLGVALVLAAVLLGARLISGASRTYGVVAATHDLAAGAVLSAGDVRVAQVQLPDHGRGVYLTDPDAVVGKRLDRPVTKGELVPAAALAHPTAQTTVTVPLADGAAPDLRAGQRIELWFAAPSCESTVLLRDVAVQSVHADTGSFSSGGGQDVVISVDPAAADRVAQALAIDQVQLRAGVLVGPATAATPTAATPTPASPPRSTTPTGAAADGASAADIAACASASPSR